MIGRQNAKSNVEINSEIGELHLYEKSGYVVRSSMVQAGIRTH